MELLVIDGNSIVNRAFYGVRPLTTRDGRPTHAVYGFLTMLGKIEDDTAPDAVAIAFDMRAPTFRHLKYSGYKAKRKGMPEELASQLQPLKDILAALGYTIVTAEGWEADDILGTLAAACTERGDHCTIATGDRDTLQLIGDCTSVRLLSTKVGRPAVTVCDAQYVMDNYGVTPPQMRDIKAIQGDTSDSIPGVPGIGEKGARELITRFGSLDGVYENIDDPSIKAGMRKKLEEGRDSAYLSYWLGTVQTDAPVPLDPEHYVKAPVDSRRVRALMTDLELFSLLKKLDLPDDGGAPADVPAQEQQSVSVQFSTAAQCIELAKKNGEARFVVVAADDADTDACKKCDLADMLTSVMLCEGDNVHILQGSEGALFVTAVAPDEAIRKSTHDLKSLTRILLASGFDSPVGFVMDTMLAAYLANPSASDYSLERLCEQYLGVSELQLPPALAAAKNAARFGRLCEVLTKTLEEGGMTALLRDAELPLACVLAEMESAGFEVDVEGISSFGESLEARAAGIEQSIYDQVGYTFNINSPKQLGEALFVKLALPGGKKTKTGYSTSADVLEGLRGQSEVIDMILEYRSLTKLVSTYCKGLVKCVAEDGRIHTVFNQTETRTGRISSAEPNLQNIPVRTELGRELRRFFTARGGCVLLDADYSQIALRVLAHMAQDKTMTDAFNNGTDIHRITASQVFGVPPEEVTDHMRSSAKAVNFGIIYGISAFSLGKDIGVATKDAQHYIDGYMATYPAIAAFMKSVVEQARLDGYVQTMYGRRRYLPELSASNFNTRAFGERVARNMPIQGTAADIIKLAMVKVAARLRKEGLRAKLILQVHDELIIEAPTEEKERAAAILAEEMENAAKLDVRLAAEVNCGENWLEAK